MITMEIKDSEYTIWLDKADSVRLFTGGHVSVGDSLIELGRFYRLFPNTEGRLLLEKGPVQHFDFRIWFWIDIDGKKYYFDLPHSEGAIELKERDEEIPIEEENYVINKIVGLSETELEITFTTDKTYKMSKHKNGEMSCGEDLMPLMEGKKDKATREAVEHILNWISVEDWLAG